MCIKDCVKIGDKVYEFDEIRQINNDDLYALFEEIRKNAYVEGYNEGHVEGYSEGYDDGYDNAREDCW